MQEFFRTNYSDLTWKTNREAFQGQMRGLLKYPAYDL
jgi:hypothetical protein